MKEFAIFLIGCICGGGALVCLAACVVNHDADEELEAMEAVRRRMEGIDDEPKK